MSSLTAAAAAASPRPIDPSPNPNLFTKDLLDLHLHRTQTDNISGRAETYHYDIWIRSAKSIALRISNTTTPTSAITTTAAAGSSSSTDRLEDQRPNPSGDSSRTDPPRPGDDVRTGATGRAAAPAQARTETGGPGPTGGVRFTTREADYTCIRPGQLGRATWRAAEMGRC